MLSSPGTWSDATFDAEDWPLFAALTHPDASEAQLQRVTLWDILALALDDYFVTAYKQTRDMTGAKAFVEGLQDFMPEGGTATPVPANQVERGLADVWNRTAPTMPPAIRSRFPSHIMEFARGNLWELANDIDGHIPDPLEYFAMRRSTSGTEVSTGLAAYTAGVVVPTEVLHTQPMQTLRGAFADTVGLRNDVHSYRKEIEDERDVNNGVLAIQHFHGCGVQDAMNMAHSLYDARMLEFERTATSLPRVFEEMGLPIEARQSTAAYVGSLRDWMAGDNEWYRHTRRYSNDDPSGFAWGVTGLGTATARIHPLTTRPT